MNLFIEALKTFTTPLEAATGKTLSKPFSIGIGLTELCNSRCTMCDFWKKKEPVLNLEQMEKILTKIEAFGVDIVNYSAHGEMFTNPDIRDIVALTTDRGFKQTWNTNALSFDRASLDKILATGTTPFLVSVGLDTANEENYARIRGIPGGLSKVMRGIQNLRARSITNIGIGAVVLDDNIDELEELVYFSEQHQATSLRFTAYQSFYQEGDHVWQRLQAPEFQEKLTAAMERLIRLKRDHPIIRNSDDYLRRIPEYYRSDYYFPYKCYVGYRRLDIDEKGEMTLCPFIGETIGNIFDERTLDEAWFSPNAEQIRKKMVRGECPGCWLSCYAEDNIRFTLKHGLKSNIEGLRRYLHLKKSYESNTP